MMRGIVFAGLMMASSVFAKMNMQCVEKHCLKEVEHALTDPVFIKSAECQVGCSKVYKEDTTPEKLVYQNCTTICALSYESPAMDSMLNCAMSFNCLTFPPIPGSCPKPEVHPELSISNLTGEWWQHRGKNALWDCYSCQHIHNNFLVNDQDWCGQTVDPTTGPVQAPCLNYTYSYDLYVKKGKDEYSTKYFQQSWQLTGHSEPGQPYNLYYSYMGSVHNETWYLIDGVQDRFMLLVDCSYMNTWIDVGSIVWVRPGYVLTDEDNARIAKTYKDKLGWDYSQFCYNKHGDANCDGPDGSLDDKNFVPATRSVGGVTQASIWTPELIDQLRHMVP